MEKSGEITPGRVHMLLCFEPASGVVTFLPVLQLRSVRGGPTTVPASQLVQPPAAILKACLAESPVWRDASAMRATFSVGRSVFARMIVAAKAKSPTSR